MKWLSKPPPSRKKILIGMSNIKSYYRNNKCYPSLVPVYHISVPKAFIPRGEKKKKALYIYYRIKSSITGELAMSRFKVNNE